MRIELPKDITLLLDRIDTLDTSKKLELLEVLDDFYNYKKTNRSSYYQPDPPMLEFFGKGNNQRIRGLIAGNRTGKSWATTYEVACHATGIYPTMATHGWDWPGIKYPKATKGWVLGYTMESICSPGNLRDLLIGPQDDYGTGWIPGGKIVHLTFANEGKGLIKEIKVEHINGGVSTIGVRVYSQGMAVLMGASLDYFLIDESPKDDTIFPQMVTRIQKAQGRLGRGMVSATPEYGLQPLIKEFVTPEGAYHKGYVGCSVWDCSHITAQDIEHMKEDYPKHQWDMRLKGLPILGSGAVYPIEQVDVEYSDIKIEDHWKVCCAVDFGWTHPAAVAFVALDVDSDIIYVFKAKKKAEWSLPEMAAYINSLGDHYPVVWPHDGDNGTQAADGVGLKDQLSSYGCQMFHERFHNPPDEATGKKNNSVEAGLSFIRTLLKVGNLKIHRSLADVWDEYRTYYYDSRTGKVVKTNDDLMDAIRYAVMSVRMYGMSKADKQYEDADFQNYISADDDY